MSKPAVNLQDSFLNQVRRDNVEIKMVLLDGTTLSGIVRGFDNFTVVIASRGTQHLVYKHAIAQIINRRTPTQKSGKQGDSRGAASDPKREKPKEAPGKTKSVEEGFNTLNLSRVVTSEEAKS